MCCCLLFSCKVVSEPLWSRELQHVRLLCPPLSPGVCSNPESVVLSNHLKLCCPLLLLPSVFPGIRVFSNELNVCIRWPKYWIFSISPSKEYSSFQWFLLGLTGLISLQSKVLSRVFTTTRIQKHWLFGAQPSLWSSYHSHTWKTTGNTIALTIWTFVGKIMSLLCNMLSRFVIAFLPRSKHPLLSWLQ